MKRLTATLSAKSIQNLIDEIDKYSNGISIKVESFVDRLADIGIPVIEINYNASVGDSSKEHSTYLQWLSKGSDYCAAKLICQGEDILFIEYGSGIHYNNGNSNPNAAKFGYGVGTYPSEEVYGHKNHAVNPGYWFYYSDDDDKTLHLSLGTKATMPMFKADMAIRTKVMEIAKEVFVNG